MRTLAILILSLLTLLSAPALGADSDKGVTAAKRGDYATALREWTPLADQRNAKAQHNLGLMYYKGDGVIQDYVQAHMWSNIARSNGSSNSEKLLTLLEELMTASQISEAQTAARDCVAKDYKGC